MSQDKDSSTTMLIGFVVGSLTIGLVVYLVLKALRETLSGLGNPQVGAGQPINIYNVTGGQGPVSLPAPVQSVQPSVLGNRMQLGDGTSLTTKTDTVTLSTARASRVFTAPRTGPVWRVRIQVLGPAGSFGSFAVDSTPDNEGSGSIVVPSGGFTEIRMGARQTLSGIGVDNAGRGVQMSYVASAEVV